jgi:phosphoribosylformimino-5-aminoimidazole carboxamide ribotide isomerase
MRILPVLDIQGGVVVRGVGGRRHEYRPLVSRLTASCQPLDVAEAFRAHFGLEELYLADLDAIAGAPPAISIYDVLRCQGFRLWVDAGFRTEQDAMRVAIEGRMGLVVGLETVVHPFELHKLCRDVPDRVVFSLDLKDGVPLGDVSRWRHTDAAGIAGQAIGYGLRRLIVLDLARVGGGGGTGTCALCRELKDHHPRVEFFAGGGVRGLADLWRLQDAGVSGALVASALHDGHLKPGDVASLMTESQDGRHS